MLQSKLDHAEEWVAIVGIQQQAAVHELAHVLATATTPDGMLMPGVMWGPMQIASVRAALDAIVTPPAMSPEQMAHKAYASHQQVRLTPTLQATCSSLHVWARPQIASSLSPSASPSLIPSSSSSASLGR